MTTPKTPQEIVGELKRAIFIDDTGEQPAIIGKFMEDWLLSSMRSLLEYVEGELPKEKKRDGEGAQDSLQIHSRVGYGIGVDDCTAKIRDIKDSI